MVSRRSFLRGSFSPRPAAIRPPWSGDETDFVSRCTRCGDCLTACPTRIIRLGDGGYPEIDFRAGQDGQGLPGGECTFCAACVTACAPQALATRDATGIRQPWRIKPLVGDTCFTHHGIVCRTCGDHCEPRAIAFPPATGGVARPTVSLANCTGCGACLAHCPASAITIGMPLAA